MSGLPAAISTQHLTKRFGKFTAVDAVSLEVRPSSVVAFLGANGSGKTTTIRMLIGLLRPTSGVVHVDGVDVLREPRRVRDRIGYMGQRVSLYRGLSLREHVEFYGGLYRLESDELTRRWGALCEHFALRGVEDEPAADLPAGLRQRAGLALAILHRPRVLFLDEPTAGVDVYNRRLFWDLIREQSQNAVTVFVTTHLLEEADYCDRVFFIHEGRLIADAEPETLRADNSEGYRVTVDVPVEDRPVAAGLLRAFGGPTDGLELCAPRVGPQLLGRLQHIRTRFPAARIRIEQPPMTDVFRRLLARAVAVPP